MDFTLKRFSSGPGVLGQLFSGDHFLCYTLEPPEDRPEHPCIPAGTYKLSLAFSPHFTPVLGHDMIHVEDVPGRSNILIHPGNYLRDTLGCIMPGRTFSTDGPEYEIYASRDAYSMLYPLVSGAILSEGVTLTIEEG